MLASAQGASVDLVWKGLQPARSETGLLLTPDTMLGEAPDVDIL